VAAEEDGSWCHSNDLFHLPPEGEDDDHDHDEYWGNNVSTDWFKGGEERKSAFCRIEVKRLFD